MMRSILGARVLGIGDGKEKCDEKYCGDSYTVPLPFCRNINGPRVS